MLWLERQMKGVHYPHICVDGAEAGNCCRCTLGGKGYVYSFRGRGGTPAAVPRAKGNRRQSTTRQLQGPKAFSAAPPNLANTGQANSNRRGFVVLVTWET